MPGGTSSGFIRLGVKLESAPPPELDARSNNASKGLGVVSSSVDEAPAEFAVMPLCEFSKGSAFLSSKRTTSGASQLTPWFLYSVQVRFPGYFITTLPEPISNT